ncbi:MAG: helix-turn-helix transcriptional regulator [Deltaproteobacteria bacterium]|nr:helix-turn-helix transcriptional regulator [Deltaproteobacteria bacterium]
MDDLDKYIEKRKKLSPKFAGLTQEQVAIKLRTKKSAISRIENHAEDIRLSTLVNYAQAVGKHLHLEVA